MLLNEHEEPVTQPFDEGKLWVELDETGTNATISYEDETAAVLAVKDLLNRKAALKHFREQGFKVPEPGFYEHACKAVHRERLCHSAIIDRPGYSAEHGVLILRSAKIVSKDKATLVRAGFPESKDYHRSRGSVEAFGSGFAPLLAGQHLLRTLLVLPLDAMVATLLGEPPSPLVEVIGNVCSPDAPARVMIDIMQGSVGTPLVPAAEVLGHYDRVWQDFSTMVIPIDEPERALAADGDRARQQKVLQIYNQAMSSRIGSDPAMVNRPPVHLVFGATSLIDIAGRESLVGATIASGIITLRADHAGGLSDVDRVIRKHGSVSTYVEKLKAEGAANEGIVTEMFAQRFLEAMAEDPRGVVERRRQKIVRFRQQGNADINDPAAVAVADVFGRFFATACQAASFGLLTDARHYGPSILHCYRHHLDTGPSMRPIIDRLEEIAGRPDVLDVRKGMKNEPELVKAARLFVKHRRNGRELWIPPSLITELLPDWRWLKRMPDVAALMITDGKHDGTYRSVEGRAGRERFICFRLPAQPS